MRFSSPEAASGQRRQLCNSLLHNCSGAELQPVSRGAGLAAAVITKSHEVCNRVSLYWSLGKEILERQEREAWGTKVLQRLSDDLRRAFPDMRAFSVRNLMHMRDLARAWPSEAIAKQLVSQLPWGHNIRILQKVKRRTEREWYSRACVQNGWSRNVLEMQIDTGLCGREGATISNFERTLPPAQSDLVQQTLKDPYRMSSLESRRMRMSA